MRVLINYKKLHCRIGGGLVLSFWVIQLLIVVILPGPDLEAVGFDGQYNEWLLISGTCSLCSCVHKPLRFRQHGIGAYFRSCHHVKMITVAA